jgi:hypothetical protein
MKMFESTSASRREEEATDENTDDSVENDVEAPALASGNLAGLQSGTTPLRCEAHARSLSTPTSSRRTLDLNRTLFVACLIALIGAGVSSAFLALGVSGSYRDQELRFEKQASELVNAVQARWKEYGVAALWVHEACRSTADQPETLDFLKICSREAFGELYAV